MANHKVLKAGYLYHQYILRLPSREFLKDVDSESGAAGPNRAWAERGEGFPDVRRQELGELLVSEGLTLGDPKRMRVGLRALSFGVRMQFEDGSFPGPEEGRPSYGATAFFMCSACSALLMLAAASHPKARDLRAEWSPRFTRAASWLAAAEPDHPELANYACGAAGAARALSAACPSPEASAASRQLCEAACELQRPDGSWPERGGSDSLYQAISLIYMGYAAVTCEDQEMQDKVGAAADRGFGWLADRIGEDGAVDCRENTRKRWERPPEDNEAILASDFAAVVCALRMWGDITEDERWHSLADRVAGWVAETKPGGERNVWEAMVSGRR